MNFEIYSSNLFNRRIVIEDQVLHADSFGQAHYGPTSMAGNWVKVIECWGRISAVYGQEGRHSTTEVAETAFTITIRYGSSIGIVPRMRVRDKVTGTLYDIRAVLHQDFTKKVVELNCWQIQ